MSRYIMLYSEEYVIFVWNVKATERERNPKEIEGSRIGDSREARPGSPPTRSRSRPKALPIHAQYFGRLLTLVILGRRYKEHHGKWQIEFSLFHNLS
jgi:hypothetical protein